MTKLDLNDAIEGAQRRLQPEVDRIVNASIASGARQVAGRRRGTALAALVAVVAVAVGGGWWSQRPDPEEHLTASEPASQDQSQRAGDDEIRDALLALLPDGVVSDVVVREDPIDVTAYGSQRGIEVTLRLDGTPVRLNLMDFNRDPSKVRAVWSQDPGPKPEDCQVTATPALAAANTPAERACASWNEDTRLRECALAPTCEDFDAFVAYSPKKEVCNYSANYPCRELADGSWLAAGTGGDDVDSDSPFTMANRFTLDGWYVYVSSDNAPAAVLTVDEVTSIATSDVWFS